MRDCPPFSILGVTYEPVSSGFAPDMTKTSLLCSDASCSLESLDIASGGITLS